MSVQLINSFPIAKCDSNNKQNVAFCSKGSTFELAEDVYRAAAHEKNNTLFEVKPKEEVDALVTNAFESLKKLYNKFSKNPDADVHISLRSYSPDTVDIAVMPSSLNLLKQKGSRPIAEQKGLHKFNIFSLDADKGSIKYINKITEADAEKVAWIKDEK